MVLQEDVLNQPIFAFYEVRRSLLRIELEHKMVSLPI